MIFNAYQITYFSNYIVPLFNFLFYFILFGKGNNVFMEII